MARRALEVLEAVTAGDGGGDEDLGGLTRPQTRGECREGIRPCPWVRCRHHLYLDVNEESGSIKINNPDVDLLDMEETCSLDVAERGPSYLGEVGQHINVTLERARQIEREALENFQEVSRVVMGGAPEAEPEPAPLRTERIGGPRGWRQEDP